jgi:Family of unknown function (DUF6941)
MKLDWMMLANHAEAQADLLYIAGGGWDTINVIARAPNAPENVAAVMQGHLAIRLLFHQDETDREHSFEISVVDEEGAEVAKANADFGVARGHGVPPGWLQNVNIVIPVSGIALPRQGLYTINLTVDGQWVGERPFRVTLAESV